MTAVCFDMYGTLCDTGSVVDALARELDVSDALVSELDATWRTRQLQYSYQLALMDEYRPFWQVTRDALDYALARYDLDPDEETRLAVLTGYEELTPFPGAVDALETLGDAGHTVAVLSNGNPAMLETLAENAGLAPHLDEVISADAVETFKPAPAVYEHAAGALGEPIEDCWLVTSNAWDAAGAGSAGMRTGWVNRARDPHERIGPAVTAVAPDLPGIVPEVL
ncbi:haloacid dehalogenase type II [Haloparvum alkalitolerans]|uniref:haloacid dehalogenase type II n=1 Tax=Haloparvum alkalitolerans TaxID=1042953 RepID=UPI003CE78273